MARSKNQVSTPPSPRPIEGTRSPLSPFAIGDRVKYIGTDCQLQYQYAGELEVWEFGTKFDADKCTCLKPDGRTTSWIEYGELTKIPKPNNSHSTK